ncbi:MAG TPA: conjugal transfer protein, partial [Ruminococcaceae bacterium]|nr:conjugal transfer protein [Oscillospiraceae bacterium]
MLKTTPEQAKRIHRLAKKACCNCYHGNCLLQDDGESHRCVQLISIYAITCKYFLNAVLPAEKEL